MAVNRVLTPEEKQTLKADPRFIAVSRQAIEDQVTFWLGQNGVNLGTEALSVRWAKSRHRAATYINQPETIASSQDRILERFIMYLKDWNLLDSTLNGNVMVPGTVIDYLIAQNAQGAPSPSTSFNALADKFFDEEIKSIFM